MEKNWSAKLEKLAPLLGVFGFVFASTAAGSFLRQEYALMEVGKVFMAMFFLTFGGFKVYNLSGFREAFQVYDFLAARSDFYATVYPFLELGLGLLYVVIIHASLPWLEIVAYTSTILLMGVGGLGVINALMDEREIKCACLGNVFNVPMTTVRLIENFGMVVMAVLMLLITF